MSNKLKDQWWNRADGSYVWSKATPSPAPNLVDRLRDCELDDGLHGFALVKVGRLIDEAADRIEALERRVAELEREKDVTSTR